MGAGGFLGPQGGRGIVSEEWKDNKRRVFFNDVRASDWLWPEEMSENDTFRWLQGRFRVAPIEAPVGP